MTGTETTGQETDSVDSVSPQAAINSTFTRIRGESGGSESVTRRASPTLRFRFAAVLVLILTAGHQLISVSVNDGPLLWTDIEKLVVCGGDLGTGDPRQRFGSEVSR
jgi:hypothetical protein